MYYVYTITNLLNNKIYAGKTKDPHERWINHKSIANVGPSNPNFYYVHKALRQHLQDIDNVFKFEVLSSFENENDAYLEEIRLIKELKSQGNIIYNLSEGGEGYKSGKDNPNYGKPRTGEIKKKISIKNTGKKRTPQQRKNISNAQIGKHDGEKAGNAKLKEKDVLEIKKLLSLGQTEEEIALLFKVSKHTIHDIRFYRTWKHLK